MFLFREFQECLIRISRSKFSDEQNLSDCVSQLFTKFITKTAFRNRADILKRNKFRLNTIIKLNEEEAAEELKRTSPNSPPITADSIIKHSDVMKDIPVDLTSVWVIHFNAPQLSINLQPTEPCNEECRYSVCNVQESLSLCKEGDEHPKFTVFLQGDPSML